MDNSQKHNEPVAWRDPTNTDAGQGCTYDKAKASAWPHIYSEPLYTQPKAPEPLTDEEIMELAEPFGAFQYGDAQGDKRKDFARAVLAAQGEKK